MIVAGLQKVSFIDYPDKIASVLFCPFCNLRCPFCHNPELVFFKGKSLGENVCLSYLQKRIGKIEAVVITGGEPTLQDDLPAFILQVKQLGFLIKLDTNGNRPDVLFNCLGLVDVVALDIKSTCDKYKTFGGDCDKLKQSLQILKNYKGKLILRTTMYPTFTSKEDLEEMRQLIPNGLQYEEWQFNEYRAFKTLERHPEGALACSTRHVNCPEP